MSVGAHGPRRPYRAGRRAKAAAETRAAILDAALRLFVENGYGSVTVGDIAQGVRHSRSTVYASTGGKSSILASLISGSDWRTRSSMRRSQPSACLRSPREAVAVATHGVRIDNERHFDLVRVLARRRGASTTAKETLTRANRSYREALGVVARRLEDLDALGQGMLVDRAADILWQVLGHHSWRVYVTDSGWSWNDTEKWLAEQVSAALLRDRVD